MKHLLLVCTLLWTCCELSAQIPEEMVYIHTDRDVYAPSDEMNFKAYLKNGNTGGSKSSQLFICLLNPAGVPVASNVFQVGNNQVSGSVVLPGSLDEGEYRILGYTDQMKKGSPGDAFTRKVFIRKKEFQELLITLKLDADRYLPGEMAELGIRIEFLDQKTYNNDQFTYLACKNGVPYQNGIGKTDEKGNASLLVRIPSTPDEGIITVAVNAESRKSKGSATVIVPAAGMPFFLNFFPEGGCLIDGLKTRVAFRAQDYEGNPMDFEGLVLDQDNQPVDTIRSSSLGIGSFELVPDLTDPLKVMITRPTGFGKAISIPKVQANGVQLILKNRSGGFLGFHVRTNLLHADQHLLAVAETGGRIIAQIPMVLDDTLSFRLPVEGIQGGIIRVSLLDKNSIALAQRSVFINPPASRIICVAQSGKGKNPEISNLSLSVEGANNQPAEATLSVSLTDAVMNPDWNREPDIRSWFLLGPAAAALPPGYLSGAHPADEILLDHLMISLIDTTLNWKQVLSGPSDLSEPIVDDFRERLIRFYQPGPFEQLIARIHNERFFSEYFLSAKTDFPAFVDANRGNLQEMGIIPGKPSQDDRIRQQLDNGIPVLSIIRTISPYYLSGNMIIFGKGRNSMEYPKGALFIIDGAEKGFNIDILSSFSPYDIAGIKVSQKISDILKYSADASALILITTKQAQGSAPVAEARTAGAFNPTQYWNPGVLTTGTGPVSVKMPKPQFKSTWRMVIQGLDSQGNYVVSVLN